MNRPAFEHSDLPAHTVLLVDPFVPVSDRPRGAGPDQGVERQGALAWELRTAASAARFLVSHGRNIEALDMLAPTYERFTEGFETADLLAARDILSKLDPRRFPSGP